MTDSPSDELLERIDRIGGTPWRGDAYRYTGARRDPLSGTGARLMGGRWNPRDLFAAIYLAIPQATCMAELDRVAESQSIPATTMLQVPYKFHTLEVDAARILDLHSTKKLGEIGLELEDITGSDWSACQMVGHAAWFLRFEGILAPSASGTGMVLTLFESRLSPSSVVVRSSEDLTTDRYEELSQIIE